VSAKDAEMTEEQAKLLQALQQTYGRGYRRQVVKLLWRKYYQRLRPLIFDGSKRLFDLVGSALLLVLLSPLFLFLMVMVRLDGGPAFYSQIRIGRHGKRFRFWKFRSMVVDADKLKEQLMAQNESADGVIFKMTHDPRITPIGRILRRSSLDELPQLYNVFRGDMSLVGPRPPLPAEVAQYNAHERGRLDTNQGITCIWQVSGRSNIGFQDQVDLDLQYIQNESIWYDIKLLLKTLPAVITGRGAA